MSRPQRWPWAVRKVLSTSIHTVPFSNMRCANTRVSGKSKGTVRSSGIGIGIGNRPSAEIPDQLLTLRFPVPYPYILWSPREIS